MTSTTRARIPGGNNSDARRQAAQQANEQAVAARRLQLEQVDRDLKAAGTPGLRMLEDFEVDELLHRYSKYVRRDRHTVYMPVHARLHRSRPTDVPAVLQEMEEFVELSNHREAVREAHTRFVESRRAWELRVEQTERDHTAALVRCATSGEPAPERPYVEPWEYDRAKEAIEQRFLRMIDAIEAAERGALAENVKTYIALLDNWAAEVLDRRQLLVAELQAVEQEARPFTDALRTLDPERFKEDESRRQWRGPQSYTWSTGPTPDGNQSSPTPRQDRREPVEVAQLSTEPVDAAAVLEGWNRKSTGRR